MQRITLLGGLGFDALATKLATRLTIDPAVVTTQIQPTSDQPVPGECRLNPDGSVAYIWIGPSGTTPGHWERPRAGVPTQCTTTNASGSVPTTRDQRDGAGGGGGILVTDPFGDPVDPGQIAVPPIIDIGDAKVRDGRAQMIQVGPFTFPADLERSAFWWSPSRGVLPADIQAAIGYAWKFGGEDKTVLDMYPGLASLFDNAPSTYDGRFVGLGRSNSAPSWAPIIQVKHPVNGKDYGVFMSTISKYPDRPMNDPANSVAIYFTWAPIPKHWYERLWNWIKSIVAKIVDFVCGALGDPTTAALVTAGAAAAGSIAGVPPQVTAGAVGGATLLCSSPAATPPDTKVPDQLAITPKPMWPYYLAGGLALFGVVAFLLVPPKKKAA